MISPCADADSRQICEVINAAARAYVGVIPTDCWHEPYMSFEQLRSETDDRVSFVGYQEQGELIGVMGSQDVQDVTLIRHAYVRPEHQRRGIGDALLTHLLSGTSRPVLVGTWTSAIWAIRFYERHGFTAMSPDKARCLLEQYWSVPERQIEASSVLVGPGGPPVRPSPGGDLG